MKQLPSWLPYGSIVRDCQTVEQFLQKYHRPDRYRSRGKEYMEADLKSHTADVETYGYTLITHHDSITGQCHYYVLNQ